MDNIQQPTMNTNSMLFYGFGGHAQVAAGALSKSQKLVGFFDSTFPSTIPTDIPYLGNYDPLVLPELQLIITIGDVNTRMRLSGEIKHFFGRIVSERAFCAPSVELGEGTVVFQHAIIQARTKVGTHCIVNAGSIIDHDVTIDNFVNIGLGAIISSNVKIGSNCVIGNGAVISRNVAIASNSIIPTGAIV